MTTREAIFAAIDRERAYQDHKWGANRRLDTQMWLSILSAELGEAWRDWIKGNPDRARAEILQVAAVAVATLESLGLEER